MNADEKFIERDPYNSKFIEIDEEDTTLSFTINHIEIIRENQTMIVV